MRSAPLASRVFLFALICGFAALGLFQLKNRFLPAELTAEFVPFGVPTGEKTPVGASLDRLSFSGDLTKEERALCERAQLLIGTGDPAGARSILDGLLALHPTEPALVALAARQRLDRPSGDGVADFAAVEVMLDRALAGDLDDPDPQLAAAKAEQLLRKRGSADEAVSWARKVVAAASSDPTARSLLARAHLAAHAPDSAVRQAAWAVTLSPAAARGEAYALLAEAHHMAGRLDSARVVCDFALPLFPMEKRLLLLRARLWEYDDELDQARAIYSRLVGLYPTDPEVSQAFATLGRKKAPSLERLASCGSDMRSVFDELSRRYQNDAEISGLLFELRSRLGLDEFVASAGAEEPDASSSDDDLAGAVERSMHEAYENGQDRFGHFRVRWGVSESEFLHQVDSTRFRRLAPGVWRTERRDGGHIHFITVHLKDGYRKVQLLVADTTGRPGDLLGHALRALTRRSGNPRATGETACPGMEPFQGFVWENQDDFTLMAQFAKSASQVRLVRMSPDALPQPFSLCAVAAELKDWKPAGVPSARGDL